MKIIPCEPIRARPWNRLFTIRVYSDEGSIYFSEALSEAMKFVPGMTISICFDDEDKTRWFIKRIGKYPLHCHRVRKDAFRIHCRGITRELLSALNLDPEKTHILKVNPEWIEFQGEHYFEILTKTEK